jgi:hypothetical protein
MQPIVEPNAIAALWPLDFAGTGVPLAKKKKLVQHLSC